MTTSSSLLEVRGLVVRYDPRRASDRAAGVKLPPAVSGIDFEIGRGECFGLIGSSGCGKTTTARALMGLIPFEGSIRYDGREVTDHLSDGRRAFARKVQMVMQNPGSSLTPRMRIGRAIEEVLTLHGRADTSVTELLKLVGLPASRADRYPHQLSGGEQQRVAIARALAVDPELLVLDEPVSSLDPVRRAEIVELLLEVQSIRSLTYLFIAHDLGLVSRLCGRLAVMHGGRIVEAGETSNVFTGAKDPFTRELLAASPGGMGAGEG